MKSGLAILILVLLTGSRPSAAAELQDPVWSPDGRAIAYYSNETGNFEVYVLDLASHRTRRITDDKGYDGSPAWLPDGRLSFASDRDGDFEIYVVKSDGSELRQITHNTT